MKRGCTKRLPST